MRRFAMPWDRALRISTGLFVAVLLAVGGGIAATSLALPGDDALGSAMASLPLAIILVVLAGTWALAPRGILVGAGQVTLQRRLRPVSIPLAQVRAVALLGEKPLHGAIRTWGAAGAFGHHGRFWSKALGPFRLFATRSERLVYSQRWGPVAVIDAPSGRILVTPDDPAAFEREVGVER